DGHLDELPAGASAALLAIPRHSVARSAESATPLDIQMEQVAGLGIFVAHRPRGGLQLGQTTKVCLFETTRNGTDGHAASLGDLSIGMARAA
ncbi:hypothetical protein, partial [Pseudomonas oryzihabitans]|uniref:hypothetical protein n=1 Tax=Pseudomonas oryzihabitans TaxID=47885 RepID=UPI003916D61B